jgi:hypothetical protein
MATMKRVTAGLLVFLAGIACGTYLHRPPVTVHAQGGGFHVVSARPGFNMLLGDPQIIGFSCSQSDCYLAYR